MAATKWRAQTMRDLIIEVWEQLDCESVGTYELEQIQLVLREKFGASVRQSPAAIARTVADEGAVLRHPEVFDCDLEWRKQNLDGLEFQESLDCSSLSVAFQSLVKIEEKRLELQIAGDAQGLTQLRGLVSNLKRDSLLLARSKIIAMAEREEAKEVSQWLTIWLQAPELFSDWLDLRCRAPQFRKKFPEASATED